MSGVPVTVVPGAVAVGGALLLAASGIAHLARPRVLRSALDDQRLLPPRLRGPVALLVPLAEAGTGAAALAVPLVPPRVAAAVLAAQSVLAAQCVLYAAFTAYLWQVYRRSPGAACGCLGGRHPVSRLAVARAGLFAIGSAVAAGRAGALVALPPVPWLLCLAGGCVAALAGWLLPEAYPASTVYGRAGRTVPTGRRPAGG